MGRTIKWTSGNRFLHTMLFLYMDRYSKCSFLGITWNPCLAGGVWKRLQIGGRRWVVLKLSPPFWSSTPPFETLAGIFVSLNWIVVQISVKLYTIKHMSSIKDEWCTKFYRMQFFHWIKIGNFRSSKCTRFRWNFLTEFQ